MKIESSSPDHYIQQLPDDRREAMQKLRQTILKNIPKGFDETIIYGSIGYVVPKSTYPDGYHCDSSLPLPFLNIASQKHFIALYHMGIYMDKKLLEWFVEEFPKHSKLKLDMGKSCIRFKKFEQIPYALIGELAKKMTVKDWINLYEYNLKSR